MSIDDRLGKLLHEFKFRTPEGAMPKGHDNTKQALYKDMLELIGEDEPKQQGELELSSDFVVYNDPRRIGRNDLRQELRTKLKEYYGVEE